ncbi:MBL fold metallo-hydrolase [Halopelagius longus]|uniref:MBL fold metallo-hydrolase n=1 Tax=Halopelagius longus TaxID=1236180 RepID=A0A1H0Z4H9_9EURY|nr:MBL fold metallo-hydrolase [Halopelagius longus]RDI72825.1 MBL fold metallo-hydrolase [Halopelagius longus]SDQ22274.1 Ribonuclease BN, tRNA processing enzyme [Halopelagius longus]
MRVTFLGTGSAMPLPDRAQTGLLLESDGRTLLVDCGSGVLGRLSATDAGYEGVGTVLLTHHHLDHVADLIPLLKARWLAGEEHLEVVGPEGTKSLVDDLLDVYDYLQDRVDLQVREVTAGAGSFEVAGFEIEATETRHSIQCLAYRFEGEEGDFVFSGDSEAFEGLANFADGAVALAHDCSFPDDVDVSNHPTPSQLGEVLAGRDIGRVYLTHLYPHTEGRHEEMLDSIGSAYDGDVRFARDGLRVDI